MIEFIYKTLLTFCWSVMLFMGFYLIFGRVVDELVSSAYERSRKLIGLGFVIFGLEYVAFSLLNLRIDYPCEAISLNLSVLSIVGNLFAVAVFPLLDDTIRLTRKKIIFKSLAVALFISIIWAVVLLSDDSWVVSIVLFVCLAVYLFQVYFWVVTLFRIYKRAKIKAENYYSECIEGSIEWLPRTMFYIVILSFACSIVAFAPMWVIIIYMMYAISVFYYIFDSLLDMTINRSMVGFLIASDVGNRDSLVVSGDDDSLDCMDESTVLRPDIAAYIDQQLSIWVESNQYLNSDITIKSLALAINTNRTYLSNYINNRYKCSFRDWVTNMRLSEAKRIMLADSDISISKLSGMVGFTSSTSFSRAFARIEGVPPNRWRDMNVVR